MVLGCPCGSASAEILAPALQRWRRQINTIAGLAETQAHVALTLLYFCVGSAKAMHLMRGLGERDEWVTVDAWIAEALQTVLARALTDRQIAQARLPVRLGGLGIRRAWQHSGCANVTAIRRAMERVHHIRPLADPNQSVRNTLQACGLAAVNSFRSDVAQIPSTLTLANDFLRLGYGETADRTMQKQLSGNIETVTRRNLLGQLQRIQSAATTDAERLAARREVARFIQSSAKYAGLKLYGSAFTVGPKLWFNNIELRSTIALQLGLTISDQPTLCVFCKQPDVADTFGDHTLTCKNGGYRTLLHNLVVRTIADVARPLHVGVQVEVRPFTSPAFRLHRLDLQLRLPPRPAPQRLVPLLPGMVVREQRSTQLLDVAITHGLGATALTHTTSIMGPTAWAEQYGKTKHDKYDPALQLEPEQTRPSLHPMVFTTLGGMSSSCVDILRQLAQLRAQRMGRGTATRIVMHRVLFAAAKFIASMLHANSEAAADEGDGGAARAVVA
jgi:hypothetical protein